MFLEHKIHYLDIIKLNEACCEAHKADWMATPNLEDIVQADAEARRWVKEQVRVEASICTPFLTVCMTGHYASDMCHVSNVYASDMCHVYASDMCLSVTLECRGVALAIATACIPLTITALRA